MNAKSTIRRVLFITVWVCIGAGMLGLLLAAISNKKKGACQGYIISFKGDQTNAFITKQDVAQSLLLAANGNIKGQPVSSINLHVLENKLEENSWIDDAELYFDNGDMLHVRVSEKKPVARVFTVSGNSFYLDGGGRKIPLSKQAAPRVPVFTGYADKKKMNSQDSLVLEGICRMSNYIMSDPLWKAQVAQVDIGTDGNFEMVPVVGNHFVRFGNAEELDKKFNRLLVFYQQVLSKTGFDKYRLIDVQFKGQVVATRSTGNAKVDSIQLRRNVEKLLKLAEEAEKDTVIKALPLVRLEADSAIAPDPSLQDIVPEKKTPKAIMPKRKEN